MKNLFLIKLTYSTSKTSVEIELSPTFKEMMLPVAAISLAYTHVANQPEDRSRGWPVLQKLAFETAAKMSFSGHQMNQALDLACRTALHFAETGRANDDFARVIILLAQACPCRFPEVRLPQRKKLPAGLRLSKMSVAAYEILRQTKNNRGPEVPLFAAYHLATDLSRLNNPTDTVRKLLLTLHEETKQFVVTMTRLAEISVAQERSKALAEALWN